MIVKPWLQPATKLLDAECPKCDATGLIASNEPGTFFICKICKGTGRIKIDYIPFMCKKTRKGVSLVKSDNRNMSYDDFQRITKDATI